MAKRVSPQPVPTEHAEQVALMQWWFHVSGRHPDAMLFAIPNGGDRHPAVAVKLRNEGVTPGVPDLFLAALVTEGSWVWPGLFIELKRRRGGRLSMEQVNVHSKLRTAGYCVAVARGWEHAAKIITSYLRGDIEGVDNASEDAA